MVASERRQKPVNAEALSRMAAAQRESFLRSRLPPRLCDAIHKDARPLRPRVWASGHWRLARRIATPDALDGWSVGLALGLCDEILRQNGQPSDAMGRVALEAVARVVGPVAAYIPGGEEEWRRLQGLVARHAPSPGLAAHTVEQARAAVRLEQHDPPLPLEALYFGLSEDFTLAPDEGEPKLLRLPRDGEHGESFDRVLLRRLGGDERALRLLMAYLQGYSHVMDELGRAPTTEDFARHWRFSRESLREDEALFRRAFPEEQTAERVLRLLERALPNSGPPARIMAVRVIDLAPAHAAHKPSAPSPGQRWRASDGADELTLIEVDGERLVGAMRDAASGAVSLWTGSSENLEGWQPALLGGVWRVRFDVHGKAANLIERLTRAGLVIERLARPGEPRAGAAQLPSATIEALLAAVSEEEAHLELERVLPGSVQLDKETLVLSRVAG
jgi:hypothetical protein